MMNEVTGISLGHVSAPAKKNNQIKLFLGGKQPKALSRTRTMNESAGTKTFEFACGRWRWLIILEHELGRLSQNKEQFEWNCVPTRMVASDIDY